MPHGTSPKWRHLDWYLPKDQEPIVVNSSYQHGCVVQNIGYINGLQWLARLAQDLEVLGLVPKIQETQEKWQTGEKKISSASLPGDLNELKWASGLKNVEGLTRRVLRQVLLAAVGGRRQLQLLLFVHRLFRNRLQVFNHHWPTSAESCRSVGKVQLEGDDFWGFLVEAQLQNLDQSMLQWKKAERGKFFKSVYFWFTAWEVSLLWKKDEKTAKSNSLRNWKKDQTNNSPLGQSWALLRRLTRSIGWTKINQICWQQFFQSNSSFRSSL